MKHNDRPSQTDASARLDTLLSEFLNKDIVEPSESTHSERATSTPLGDPFDVAKTRTDVPGVLSAQKIVPVNRTEVWEATTRPTSASTESPVRANRALDQLEGDVNSILASSPATIRGKKAFLGSLVIMLLIVASLLIWKGPKTGDTPQVSEEPVTEVPSSEIDTLPPTEPKGALNAHEGPGSTEVVVARNSSGSPQPGAPGTEAQIREASTHRAAANIGPSQTVVSNAAKLQQMPAPNLAQSATMPGTIQGFSSVQPAPPPPAPLPSPPNPQASSPGNVPPNPQAATATPAVPLTRVQPVYPELARRLNVTGTVKVAITVDTTGKVTSAKAIDGPPVLRASAEVAVKEWRFKPATMNGWRVTSNGTVLILFNGERQ